MTDVNVRESVTYGCGGGRELRCDIYSPKVAPSGAPVLLLLHGGGWREGDRGRMRGYGQRFAAAGFVCVAPEYRLTGESLWPAQIEDVKAAIRWTRQNSAELGVAPESIAALGSSAGAHLALLAAGTPNLPVFAGGGGSGDAGEHLAAVIAIYPPVLFFVGETRPHGASPAETLMGEAANEELASRASPLRYAGPDFPPTFFLHGTADKVVPPSASRVMYEALVQAGVPAEMHLYADQPHGFAGQPEFIDLVCAEGMHFLRRQLASRQSSEASIPAVAG